MAPHPALDHEPPVTNVALAEAGSNREQWLDLLANADISASSSASAHPITDAFRSGAFGGWQAGRTGPQIIRIRFHQPRDVQRIQFVFASPTVARLQELVVSATSRRGERTRQVMRATSMLRVDDGPIQLRDHQVSAFGIEALEIRIEPDLHAHDSVATLRLCRVSC
jgi:hypothetical protein